MAVTKLLGRPNRNGLEDFPSGQKTNSKLYPTHKEERTMALELGLKAKHMEHQARARSEEEPVPCSPGSY